MTLTLAPPIQPDLLPLPPEPEAAHLHAVEALRSLGPDADSVATSLRVLGIDGGHGATNCPLHNYLLTRGFNYVISTHICTFVGGTYVAHMEIPLACRSFITRFDSEAFYDDLEAA